MRGLTVQRYANLWRTAAVCSLLCGARRSTVLSECISRKYEAFPKHVGCLEASRAAMQPRGVGIDDVNTIVAEMANIRAQVPASDMQVLKWDVELQSLAQRWAENCNATRDENLSVPGRFATVGQIVLTGLSNWLTAVVHWGGTQQSFTYGNLSVMNYDLAVDYAQLVWAGASLVGCGFSMCAGIGKYYVCNFAPGRPTRSNYAVPYTSGRPCAACPEYCNRADAVALCDCGNVVCQNGGTLRLLDCSCACAYPHDTGPNCGLSCSGAADPAACSSKKTSDCQASPAVGEQCPNLCQLCPYAAADYKPPPQGVATTANYSSASSTAAAMLQEAGSSGGVGAAVLALCARWLLWLG